MLTDVVPVNVPSILGLDVLDTEELYADIVSSRMVYRKVLSPEIENLKYKETWHIPRTRHVNHLRSFIKFAMSALCTSVRL